MQLRGSHWEAPTIGMVILVCSCVLSRGVSRHPRVAAAGSSLLGVVRCLPGVGAAVSVTATTPKDPREPADVARSVQK